MCADECAHPFSLSNPLKSFSIIQYLFISLNISSISSSFKNLSSISKFRLTILSITKIVNVLLKIVSSFSKPIPQNKCFSLRQMFKISFNCRCVNSSLLIIVVTALRISKSLSSDSRVPMFSISSNTSS